MKISNICLCLLWILGLGLLYQTCQAQCVFPTPESVEQCGGHMVISPQGATMYVEDGKSGYYLRCFQNEILRGIPVAKVEDERNASICWKIDTSLPSEGYSLSITPNRMTVMAADEGGFVYAVQTLRQWATTYGDEIHFACVRIKDAPRCAWRCFMLDSGRQYQRLSVIKKYIDMASMLKMNYFHWHLTEGLGWRIEIKKYPDLTGIGSRVGQGKEQQGYYSQEEIKEIVQYATERHVTIVPEIDIPGHAEAALYAYPWLGCFGEKNIEIPQEGFTKNIFCAGKSTTLAFLRNVLDEVCSLFPSPYVHLGGDEAPKGNWDNCPDCQQQIRRNGLQNSHELQMWLSSEMAKYLKEKGRMVVFWGDLIYKDTYPLPDNVVIQWWNYRGHKDLAVRNALKHGYPIICSPNYYTYLNFPIIPWKGYKEERTFDFQDIYTNNPADKLIACFNPLILGMTCALWTDFGLTEDLIDQRLFPRIIALAEQMWHRGEREDWKRFYERVMQQEEWFESMGYSFGSGLREENTWLR